MRAGVAVLTSSGLACALACGSADSRDGAGGAHDAAPAGATSDAAPGASLDGGLFADVPAALPPVACSKETQLVYVVDHDRNLYGFDPVAVVFTPAGKLDCTTHQIFSMAVDRNAIAWALAEDGTLLRYDIRNRACTLTSFPSGQQGFVTFGMGFASNAPGSNDETLFVASASGLGLATIDTSALTLTPVGLFDKLPGRVELSGTGDAKLYGLFESSPYVVAEVDKASAKVLSQAPQSVTDTKNFAFAFWGGTFQLFVGSDVMRYDPATKTTKKLTQVAFEIVGAGVSTCAPTSPPK